MLTDGFSTFHFYSCLWYVSPEDVGSSIWKKNLVFPNPDTI